MIGFRLNSFSESSGEPEQDANSALTELDKGLRSGKVGEQCEAIVRFPRLFEKYPFPILINSSFLKLSDVFRMGNNFLRLWVLRVCQQSEKHLDKILNVDEFLRRVFSVLHSNDPVARALALKTLGAVAGIIPERQNVHHAIRRGLDSHDDVEVDAAIYATTRFAAHSNTFAVAMCNKLSDMVECENTGSERRDKLVRALRTVHGGAIRAQTVLELLRSLMQRFPSSSSTRAAISALTAIADDTVVHVPDQVELLLDIAVNEARASVRRAALLGLKKLAEHAALWPASAIQSLVIAASSRSHDTQHTLLCLQVMQILVKCPAVCAGAGLIQRNADGCLEPSLLRSYCQDATMSVKLDVAATAADVLTHIVVHCYEESLPVDGADLMLALEALVIATGQTDGKDYTKPLRVALSCLVQLCNVEPSVYGPRTAAVLGSQLDSLWESPRPAAARGAALLEALAARGGSTGCPGAVQPAADALRRRLLEETTRMDVDGEPANEDNSEEACTALVLLCTVVCQERAGTALTMKISDEWEQTVIDALRNSDGWTRYRVARAALRYGHHNLAATILSELGAAAPHEASRRWLLALRRAAAADAMLQGDISRLEEASSQWELAAAAGGGGLCGGCGGCAACAGMAGAWMSARASLLASLARCAAAARAMCTQPPPAVAVTHAQAVRSPAAKAGACTVALKKAAAAVRAATAKYNHIAKGAFHADAATLRHLHIIQHTYNLLAQFLERITTTNYAEKQALELSLSSKELKATNLEEKILLSVCDKLEEISNKLFNSPTTVPGMSHRHTAAVLKAVEACTTGTLFPRGVCGGSAGRARCRLALNPAPRPPPAEHAATLCLSHHLALKIEGVILPPYSATLVPAEQMKKRIRKKKQEERQVKGVQLTVTATPHPRTSEKTVELTNIPPVLTAVQTVTPMRDFFSAQQLVSVNAPGLYTVTVEAAFIDQRGELCLTGPKASLVIKAHEDPASKGNPQGGRGRF
ncbi:hypothetical protein JYU34_017311 [Plutella xylostella]|uniref:Integrator complex subunit 7 n=1 Tax=Plutella xylostella TaxID=51655 RepID=A0ABQ7Q0U3_PLUXY|nr:hypothetical protein JYU34_017311 [Plutella xylostella]